MAAAGACCISGAVRGRRRSGRVGVLERAYDDAQCGTAASTRTCGAINRELEGTRSRPPSTQGDLDAGEKSGLNASVRPLDQTVSVAGLRSALRRG